MPREHLIKPFFEKHKRIPAQASGPADLMLSDMTFMSCPAPWKAPRVLFLPLTSPHRAACLGLFLLWPSTYCHLLLGDSTGTATAQHTGAAEHD